jgi:hypothetical protein
MDHVMAGSARRCLHESTKFFNFNIAPFKPKDTVLVHVLVSTKPVRASARNKFTDDVGQKGSHFADVVTSIRKLALHDRGKLLTGWIGCHDVAPKGEIELPIVTATENN